MSASDSTLALIDYLRRWPRRALIDALRGADDAQTQVLDGRISLPVGRRRRRPRVRGAFERAVGFFDPAFPAALRLIPDPPLVLYYRGDLEVLGRRSLALVGARRATSTGLSIAGEMGATLARVDWKVVSGLAYGIDAAAHTGAVSAGAGSTIAVLGSGLERIYPRAHAPLARRILDASGLLLSEYPDAVGPRAHHFPERNRLISGLSNGVVVVEASERSGSLITARLALEQGRDVYAVPGSVRSAVSAGCHRLIKEGAMLVTSADDLLVELGVGAPAERSARSVTGSNEQDKVQPEGDARRVLDAIAFAADVTHETLSTQLGWEISHVIAAVAELELAGFVRTTAQGYIAPL